MFYIIKEGKNINSISDILDSSVYGEVSGDTEGVLAKVIDKNPYIIMKILDSISESEPTTNGLLEVLVTCLSILKSLISLITHPNDLTSTEPTITII